MPPAVSIILPSFNRLNYLRDALESVFAQTFKDWELIIADDGSSDDTRAFLSTFVVDFPRIQCLWLPHSANPPVVRNAALREARGHYVAFLDSDDVWMPQKLQVQIASLSVRSARKWSYTGCVLVDGSLEPLVGARAKQCPAHDGWILEPLLKGEPIVVQSSVMASRELLLELGGYAEDLPICGDYDLYVRLAQRSEVDFVEAPLVLVRRHSNHYCDDIAALTDLRRFIDKVHRSGTASQLNAVLRRRRAIVSAGIARGYSLNGDRARFLSAVLASVGSSWRYGGWWRGILTGALRAHTPRVLWAALRRYRLREGRAAAKVITER
jgi:glycosyltransferase involved in cell wall biosynthesis